jgi:hypothetical protein
MKSHVFGFALLSVAAVGASAPAQAASTRTFVSSSGVDTNPCTITQPCATFAGAYANTLPNGIIAALDPGKYGPLTITTGLTINGNGWAAITGPAGGDAIDITAASGNVTLIGLELDGAGAGKHGIFLMSTLTGTAALNVRDCVVSNFTDSGIAIQPSAQPTFETMFASILNSYSQNNGNGIKIAPTGMGIVYFVIDQTTVNNNSSNGFEFSGNVNVVVGSITRSQANYNGNDGILLNGSTVTIKNCYVTINNIGLSVTNSGIMNLSGSELNFQNSYDVYVDSGSAAFSYGDNNITEISGTLMSRSLQ